MTKEFAEHIGADAYTESAVDAAELAKTFIVWGKGENFTLQLTSILLYQNLKEQFHIADYRLLSKNQPLARPFFFEADKGFKITIFISQTLF